MYSIYIYTRLYTRPVQLSTILPFYNLILAPNTFTHFFKSGASKKEVE